jgi:hypothetical protein
MEVTPDHVDTQDDAPEYGQEGTGGAPETEASLVGATTHEAGPTQETRAGSKRGIFWILAGIVVTGVVAGWEWWRKLPK